MKPLLCLILLLTSTVMVFAPKQRAKPVTATWRMTTFAGNGNYAWSGADANIAQFPFPTSYPVCCFPAFLTRLMTTNLTGKTINATVEIVTQGTPAFVFGGQISNPPWNLGSTPPHARLYFSSDNRVYDNRHSDADPTSYWWSRSPLGWVALTNIVGQVTLTANTSDPSLWSCGNGTLGSQNVAAFNACVANVKQIGMAISGGSFFDIGCIVTNGVPTAFRLVSFALP